VWAKRQLTHVAIFRRDPVVRMLGTARRQRGDAVRFFGGFTSRAKI